MPNKPQSHRPKQPRKPDARPSPSRRGYNWDWFKPGGIRDSHLRAHPLCEDCQEQGLIVAAEHVDHRDGNVANNDQANHQSLCRSCHSRKTAKEDGGFGMSSARSTD